MDEKSLERIKEGLFKAIQAEDEGYSFYRMAAGSSADPKGREIFQKLAEDELLHMDFLKKQLKAFTETGEADRNASLGTATEYLGESPIFSQGFKQRIGDAHQEMSALSIGIQLELNAIKFYKAEAGAVEDETVKKFYSELADWESGHYHALLKQYDSLKEDYWNAAGFAPF